MAWWITVYCRRDASSLGADDLARGLRDADPAAPAGVDYEALAEGYGVSRDAAALALQHLVVTGELEVRYVAAQEARPLFVHVWTTPDRLQEETEEAREVRRAPSTATPYLEGCRAVVGVELGFSMLEDMGVVIGYEIARYVAQKFDGAIVDDDDLWQRIDGHGAFVPLAED